MKKIAIVLVLLMVLVGCGSKGESDVKYRIGVVQLADHPSLDAAYEGMLASLDEQLGKGTYSVDYKNAQGDNTSTDQIVSKFVSDDVDLIYAIATNAAQSAYNQAEEKGIPVIFNAVTDPVAAGLVESMEVPGGHVSGVSDISPVEKQLKIVTEILPSAKKVGIMYNIGEANSISQIETINQIAPLLGLEVVAVGVSEQSEIPLSVEKLVKEVDALYNITDNMMVSASATLIDAATSAGIPVIATEDGAFDQGVLATESLSYYGFGQAAAEMMKAVLVDGKDIGTLPVVISDATNLYVNQEKADELGIEIPQSVKDRVV
ncbi:MAG: ABC transporter substrate-binding protein, partial [Erysipelothrix sp.]|nr:ABC transporter substrate-binding protein [Erysipelothrix sp.]